MVEVTVIGDINVDLLTSPIKSYPKKDKQIAIDFIQLNPGGSSFNLALACSRLGIKTQFIGKVGNDLFGNYLLKVAKENKIISRIKISKNEKTGITFAIAFKDKSRSFISYKGTNNTFSVNDFLFDEIKGKVLAISGFNLLNSLRKDVWRIIDYGKKIGAITSLDPNWDPDGWTEERIKDIYEILKKIDWFFPDLEEGEALTYTKNDILMVKKMINLGTKNVFLKEGDKGCLFGKKEYIKLIPSFKVNSINTTGAGDVFHAGFIKAFLLGYSIEDCVIFANAAGALSTTKVGIDRYPTEKEVKEFLSNKI